MKKVRVGDTVKLPNGFKGVVETVRALDCWVWLPFGSGWVQKGRMTVDAQKDANLINQHFASTEGAIE